ncbi:MAG: zinc ribbon domain-containing protein [Actinobacteria bacterium]|nr:zinc ribbon domain-containing protein [Actinomycetota bacterium]
MPIYEYRCPEGHTFELFHRMSDPPPEGCTVCGAVPVEKVLYPVAVHFKGSGFYSTDYGRGNKRRETGDGDGSGSSSDAKAADAKGDKAEKADKPASPGKPAKAET